MSLDERLREELPRSVHGRRLDEDGALDHVRLTHRRGVVRTSVLRQATAAAVALSLFAAVAIFVSWRSVPDRFRSTATVRVAAAAGSATGSRPLKLADPRKLALAASTRRAVLLSAHLAPDDAQIDFRATFISTRDLLSLAATGPSPNQSTAITRKWVSVLAKARRADAIRQLRAMNRVLTRRVTALHDLLIVVDTELARLAQPPPAVSVRYLNLVNERIQILTQLSQAGREAARSFITPFYPHIFATPIAQTPATRVDQTPPATVPALVSWAIGLVLVLAGALLTYRRRTRTLGQPSAYSR